MPKFPEGITPPNYLKGEKLVPVKAEDLVPDPAGRLFHYLHEPSGDVFNFGVDLDEQAKPADTKAQPAEKANPANAKDLTGTRVKFPDGLRAVVTETGGEDDAFFVRVQTETGEEREVKAKADVKPLTKAEIAAWDKEVEDAKG